MKKQTLVVSSMLLCLFVIGAILGCGGAGTLALPVFPFAAPRFLFAINEGNDTVSAYKITAGTGALTAVTGSPFPVGTSGFMVFGDVDPAGKFVYVAMQNAPGQIAVLGVDQNSGALTPVNGSPFNSNGNDARVAKVDPSGQFLYVTNDGSSTVQAFKIGADGTLTTIGSAVATGAGPSGIAIDPATRFLYVMNRTDNSISAYSIAADGSLTAVSGSPFSTANLKGNRFGIIDPTGRFLYVANRSGDNLSAFSIDRASGALAELTGSPYATGKGPLQLDVSPDGKLLVVGNFAGADSTVKTISVFARDFTTGALTEMSGSPFDVGQNSLHSVKFDPSGQYLYALHEFDSGGTCCASSIVGVSVNSPFSAPTITGSPFTSGGTNFATQILVSH